MDLGYVKFEDNNRLKALAIGTIGISPHSNENVLLVRGLKFNLLSISQLCGKGFNISFNNDNCKAHDEEGKMIFEGYNRKIFI